MLTNIYQINGNPIPAPDENVQIRYENVGDKSLLDEAGFLHKQVRRRGVTTWVLRYSYLSRQQRDALMDLLTADTFWFTHPDRLDSRRQDESLCYLDACSECLQSALSGSYRDVCLTIRQC